MFATSASVAGTTRRPLGTLIAMGIAAIVIAALVAPQDARAHATAGVPHHALNLDEFEFGGCRYSFPRPHTVYGFAKETVYWRPIAATYTASGWSYVYDAWDSAVTSPTGMLPPWYSTNGWGEPTPVFGEALYPIYLRPGLTYWVGQEIHYGSNGYRHVQWLGQTSC
jgi:hypothetical protein